MISCDYELLGMMTTNLLGMMTKRVRCHGLDEVLRSGVALIQGQISRLLGYNGFFCSVGCIRATILRIFVFGGVEE